MTFFIIIIYLHVCVCVCICGGQRVSDLLDLELQVVVSCLIRMLGILPGSSAGAVCALNH